MRIAIIIPALNEAENLPRLINAIPRIEDCQLQIILVDNGSTDDTAGVARRLGARVVTEPRRGYGWACHTGVRAATESEAIVFLDGDYSSDPHELPRLIQPLLENQADLVLGSRLLSGNTHAMLPHQTFGNVLTAFLMRRLYGQQITDLSPYRAVRTQLLLSLNMREMTFGYPTEMLIAQRPHVEFGPVEI
jgi:glycosyltransferase involved in cell wall biosynthesis